MKKARCFLPILLVLVGVSGCGDAPNVLVHDLLVFWNEVCDNMLRATNEETAKELLKVQFKLLDKKYEVLKDRVTKRLKDLTKDEAKELENALLDYYYEIKATEERLENRQKGLQALISGTTDHASLTKILNWPESKRDFNKISLDKYMPTRADQLDPNRPTQFGNGLVMARPQLKPRQQPVTKVVVPPGEQDPNVK